MERRSYLDPSADYNALSVTRHRGPASVRSAGPPSSNRQMEHDEDLALLDTLDDNTLLSIVKSRFQRRLIHTYVGESIMIVNPYQDLNVYGAQWHSRYVNLPSRRYAEPHVYHVADKAFRTMRSTNHAQCILVSGESGSGKTETTKYIIKHFSFICHDNVGDLHERIVEVNPLLEAFGNAVTLRNSNSSRFGKLIEMQFNDNGQVVSANVLEYMLEKSRVVRQSPGETNFHIFYCLFAGMSIDKLRHYYLEDPNSYRILQTSGQPVLEDTQVSKLYALMFDAIESIFEKLGFNEDMKSLVYLSLAAVLFITNIQFTSRQDSCSDACSITSDSPIGTAADLLNVDINDFAADLLCNTTEIRGEILQITKSLQQASDDRDALAKALYARLFSWIVYKINENLQSTDGFQNPNQTIGVLDLSGFENFQNNSFEQLCINIANEHVHQLFKKHLISIEEEVYADEGISWQSVQWDDDNQVLQLSLMKPMGLLELLDEESKFPESSDKSLLAKWHRTFRSSPFVNFSPTATRRPSLSNEPPLFFTVRHFAGKVEYSAEGFLEKNRDRLSPSLKKLMESSSLEFIKDLFTTQLDPVGRISKSSVIRTSGRSRPARTPNSLQVNNSKPLSGSLTSASQRNNDQRSSTVSQHFRNSLEELVNRMKEANPHFVWCIKPNGQKATNDFNDQLVLGQLRYNGIMQVAMVRKNGFAVRQPFNDFVTEYRYISAGFARKMPPTAESCQRILHAAGFRSSEYAVGRSKVFLKQNAFDSLQILVRQRVASVTILQSAARGFLARRRLVEMRRRQAELDTIRRNKKAQQMAAYESPADYDSKPDDWEKFDNANKNFGVQSAAVDGEQETPDSQLVPLKTDEATPATSESGVEVDVTTEGAEGEATKPDEPAPAPEGDHHSDGEGSDDDEDVKA